MLVPYLFALPVEEDWNEKYPMVEKAYVMTYGTNVQSDLCIR